MTLTGEIKGHTLIFREVSPNLFKSDLPNIGGVHLIHLRAIDDAGNVADAIHSIAMIDFDNLCFKLMPPNYSDAQSDTTFCHTVVEKDDYNYKVVEDNFTFTLVENPYCFTLIGGV